MGWIGDALTKRLLMKLAALVCALALWVYVESIVPAARAGAVVKKAHEGPVADVDSPGDR